MEMSWKWGPSEKQTKKLMRAEWQFSFNSYSDELSFATSESNPAI